MDGDVRKTLAAQAGLLTELLTQATSPILHRRDIGFATFELLTAIKSAGTRATQASIAERLGISPPTLTEAIQLAKHKGLIVQNRSTHDNRAKHLGLTPLGEQTLREVIDKVNQAERAMVEGIDPERLSIVIETLQRVNMNLARALQRREGSE